MIGSQDTTAYTRVELSHAAEELLSRLAARHGPLMFHQSGGCCDGSSPLCFPDGDFLVRFLTRSWLMSEDELKAFDLL